MQPQQQQQSSKRPAPRNVVDERVSVATEFVSQYYSKLSNKTELHNREHSKHRRRKLSRDDFELLTMIGRGAFGEVRLVKYKQDPSGKVYVMKMVKKEVMIAKNHVTHVRTERNLMVDAGRDNPWLVKLIWTFQDPTYLYFIMEFCQGGDLMFWLIQKDTFEERVARFYIAELVLAVYSLHQMDYAHRDLKPDNVLLDSTGHIKLTDFGFAKRAAEQQAVAAAAAAAQQQQKYLQQQQQQGQQQQQQQNNNAQLNNNQHQLPQVPPGIDAHAHFRLQRQTNRQLFYSTVGSPGYIAPEVLLQKGHDASVDWWAVGVILYEMLYGYPPFYGDAGAHTGHKIARWREYLEFPKDRPDVSQNAVDLIKRLVCDAKDRLSIEEILRHPFFTGIDWSTLRTTQAPFQIEVSSPLDTRYFDQVPEQPPTQSNNASSAAGGNANQQQGVNIFFYGFTSKGGDAPGVTMTMTKTNQTAYNNNIMQQGGGAAGGGQQVAAATSPATAASGGGGGGNNNNSNSQQQQQQQGGSQPQANQQPISNDSSIAVSPQVAKGSQQNQEGGNSNNQQQQPVEQQQQQQQQQEGGQSPQQAGGGQKLVPGGYPTIPEDWET